MSGRYSSSSSAGKMEKWLINQVPGKIFISSVIGKQLNLSSCYVGNFARMHDKNFEKEDRGWRILDTVIP